MVAFHLSPLLRQNNYAPALIVLSSYRKFIEDESVPQNLIAIRTISQIFTDF